MISLSDMLRVMGMDSQISNTRNALIGMGVTILARSTLIGSCTLKNFHERLSHSIDLNQLQFYFDRFGRNCGHLWWTKVSKNQDKKLMKFGPHSLSINDFSEDGEIWVLDFHAAFGMLLPMLRRAYLNFAPISDTVNYVRHKREMSIITKISLQNNTFISRGNLDTEINQGASWLLGVRGGANLKLATDELKGLIIYGALTGLLAKSEVYGEMLVTDILKRINILLTNNQFKLLRSSDGDALLFYSWAWRDLNKISSFRPLHELEAFQWRDGRDAFVCDAVSIDTHSSIIRQELALFEGGNWISYPGAPVEALKMDVGTLYRSPK